MTYEHRSDGSYVWQDFARCTEPDIDREWFFPSAWNAWHYTAVAKRACAACLVRTNCLDYALEHEIPDGIFGGLRPDERRKLVKGKYK